MANINMKAVSAILKAELALKDTSKPVEIQKEIAVLKLC